jgi:hypothetical protein
MFIHWLREVEAGRGDELSDNEMYWLTAGVDRSGLAALLFDINNVIERGTGIGAYGAMMSILPGRSQELPATKYAGKGSLAAQALGPTGDFVDTLYKMTAHAANGDITESDVNGAKRLLPYGNHPVPSWILNEHVMPRLRSMVED